MEGHPADQRAGRRCQQQAGVLAAQQPAPRQQQLLPPGPKERRAGADRGTGL